jgi:DNA-binding SARP family transcriptional activator
VDEPRRDPVVGFRLLGPVSAVDAAGAVVALGSSRQRAVLACLLVGERVPVPVARLIELLWGCCPPPTAATMVHTAIAGLRNALEPGRRGGDAGLLVTRDGGYVLRVSPDAIDTVRFERLLTEGRRAVPAAPERAHRLLVEALGLWTGPALAGVEQAFARDEADRLDSLRVQCAELKAEADLRLGLHQEVVSELGTLVSGNPLREPLSRLLMVALYRCGRQSEALSARRPARAGGHHGRGRRTDQRCLRDGGPRVDRPAWPTPLTWEPRTWRGHTARGDHIRSAGHARWMRRVTRSTPDLPREPIKQPRAYQRTAYYPTTFAVHFDDRTNEYVIALGGLIMRTAS